MSPGEACDNGPITYPKEELDLEIFLTILDALVDPQNTIKDLGPFGIYLYKLLEHKELVDRIKRSAGEIQKLKEKSIKQIAKLLGNPNSRKAKELYDELFSLDSQNINKKNADGHTVYNIFDYVATTNY